MKTVSLMIAGLLGFGLATARAETGNGGTTVEVTPPGSDDVNVKTPPKTDVNVNVNPPPNGNPNAPENKAVSPSPPIPGTTETPPAANVNVDVNPTTPPPPVPTPMRPNVMPPARTIDANTAAMYGGVTESYAPVGPRPFVAPPKSEFPLKHSWVSFIGAGVLVGGGFEDFTNSNLRSMTGTGGNWTARVLAGTRRFVGLEAAYVGSARSIDVLGL